MRAGGTRRWSRIRLSAPTVEPAANAANMKPASLRSPPVLDREQREGDGHQPQPAQPIAAAAVMPRSSGIETIWRIPPPPRRAGSPRPPALAVETRDPQDQDQGHERKARLDQQRGLRPEGPRSPPASAGPTTSALLKLVVSSAFAGVSRSSGTSTGMKLVKPPNDSR